MKKHSIKKLASFSTVRYFSFFLLAMRGYLVAGVLGPEGLGLYSIVIILQQQFSFFGLGVRESVSLQLAKPSINDEQFSKIFIAAFWFTVTIILILNLISWGMSLLVNIWDYEVYNLQMALKLAAFTIGSEILANIARARGKLEAIMVGEFGYATLSFFIFLVISQFALFADIFLNWLLICNVIIFFYYLIVNKDLFKMSSFCLKELKQLVVLGIPILIQNTCVVFLYSAGHYYLTLYADTDQLGLYSFAFNLAILGQLGVQAVLWAKFSEMLTLFSQDDNSVDWKNLVFSYSSQIVNACQVFMILSIIVLKLFLVKFVSWFFPEFILSVPLVVIIFMALYWPILAVSEGSILLAKKRFSLLYISSGAGIFILGLLLFIYRFYIDSLSAYGTENVIAVIIFSANFVFYCMLKFYGGQAIGKTLFANAASTFQTISLVCILAGCYYSNMILIPTAIMLVMCYFLLRKLQLN